MEREKREEMEKEIVILDAGIDMEELTGPKMFCCRGPVGPFRW